jgi:hypothetical protein
MQRCSDLESVVVRRIRLLASNVLRSALRGVSRRTLQQIMWCPGASGQTCSARVRNDE